MTQYLNIDQAPDSGLVVRCPVDTTQRLEANPYQGIDFYDVVGHQWMSKRCRVVHAGTLQEAKPNDLVKAYGDDRRIYAEPLRITQKWLSMLDEMEASNSDDPIVHQYAVVAGTTDSGPDLVAIDVFLPLSVLDEGGLDRRARDVASQVWGVGEPMIVFEQPEFKIIKVAAGQIPDI